MKNEPVQQRIHESLTVLRALRDELRVQLHLAGMEAKERWQKLEPRMHEVEKIAEHATERSRHAIEQLVADVKQFRQSLKQ